ncbi:MAG: hypothetical protein AAGF12_21450 [Myxococcota bacterium]
MWKGALMLASRRALAESLPHIDQTEQLIPKLSPAGRKYHTQRIVLGRWYPERPTEEILEAAAELAGQPLEEFCFEVGQRSMARQQSRIGQSLLQVLVTPQMVARYANQQWQKLRTSGALATELSDHSLRIELRHWPGHTRAMCAANWGAFSYLWHHVRLAGGGSVRRSACVGTGARACVFELEVARTRDRPLP